MNNRSNPTYSYKDIILTQHSIDRMQERFGITGEKQIKQMAKAARDKGILVARLTASNREALQIDLDTFNYLKMHYGVRQSKERHYYHKDRVWVFSGNHSRTLKTVVPCTEYDIQNKITKTKLNKTEGDIQCQMKN